jgi:signal transduction histidine kinase
MSGLLASYRVRLPLALSVTAVSTAALMALALGLQTLKNLRDDQGHNALRLGHAMAGLLVTALRQDDVWLAYSLLLGPDGDDGPLIWVVADEHGRIFASNRPRIYRLDLPLEQAMPWLDQAGHGGLGLGRGRDADLAERVIPIADHAAVKRLVHLPLTSEGTHVGDLVALLSDRPFLERFYEILLGGVLVTAAVLALLLPVGWLWGRRLVQPLIRLADCMTRVGRDDLRTLECPLASGDDEIGQLGRCFTGMLGALTEQAQLERRVLQSERLAAVGRVAAGVAHEVNNPLGGMVMAIDTYREGRLLDTRTGQLLDLLDRGLRQIQNSVSALLVEARPDSRSLTRADCEDVRTLAEPKLTRSGASLVWNDGLDFDTNLPATPVRQLLLNLVLNALEAASEGGQVTVAIGDDQDELRIDVANTGRPLPAARLEHLFEPYPARRGEGEGLGLWVCYQIVSQLQGSIDVSADGPTTRVAVRLPLHPGDADA